MNIVHVISSLERGGAQEVLYTLASELKQKGHQQSILYMHDGANKDRLASLGIPMYRVQGMLFSFDPVCVIRLITLLRKLKPDCIHTLLWGANWVARLAARIVGIPCINTLHNNYDQNGVLRTFFDRCNPYGSTSIVAVSDEVKRSFTMRFSEKNIIVIKNGINVHMLQQWAIQQPISREAIGLKESNFVIGTVGRFHPVKRFDLLLKAFVGIHGRFPRARLLLIGEGDLEQELKDQAQKHGIFDAVRFIIGESAQKYLPLFDCFTLSSSKEGISIALLEAMSLGIPPVITYYKTQHPVIIDGENGHVALCGDWGSFATKLEAFISNKELARKVGEKAQQYVVKNYDASHMISSYSSLFCRVAAMRDKHK